MNDAGMNTFNDLYGFLQGRSDAEIGQIIRTLKELFVRNVGNAKELSIIIDKYLLPQELEKKKNAEITTPYKLRQEMLDSFPADFWTIKHTVFEPCCGKGGFLLDIIDRFMTGLSAEIVDEKERYRVVVEECLYWSDINPTNIFICKLLIDPYKQYSLKFNEGDTIDLDIKTKWGVEEFDAVIGNPPFNEDSTILNDAHIKPVYQNWVYKLVPITRKFMFITPSKWFSSIDAQLVDLRNYIKTCRIKFIVHRAQDDVFKNVKIKGGVSYYLIDKDYDGETLFNNEATNISNYDIILEPRYYRLISYLTEHDFCGETLSELYTSQGKYITNKSEKELSEDSEENVPCYVSKSKGFKKYIGKDKIKNDYDCWKVITTAAAYSGTSGFSNMFIGTNEEIHSRSYISFSVKNKEEAESLYSYLKCKLPHVLLSTRKITHNMCNKDVFKWIPLIPLDRIWTNDTLYEYFHLPKDLIELVKDVQIPGSYTR